MPKRQRDPTQSSQSQDGPASTPSASAQRTRKKARVVDPSNTLPKTSVVRQEPSLPSKPAVAQDTALATTPSDTKALGQKLKDISKPKKRVLIPGTLKRLGVPRPVSLSGNRIPSGSTKPDVNRRGNKVGKGWGSGGFESTGDLGEVAQDVGVPVTATDQEKGLGKEETESVPRGVELWITRKTSYPAYLRAGVAAFIEKGNYAITLRALGAAIPVCMSLAMAIRDALPCGEKGSLLDVRTGSVDVNDEIVPPDSDEEEDIHYQTRTKSSIQCTISLKKSVRNRLLVSSSGVSMSRTLGANGMGVRPGRGGRGKPLRGGGGRGRGASSGRGK